MINLKLIEIIKEQGIGRYMIDLKETGGYLSYISMSLTNENKYSVIFTNPHIRNSNKCLYHGPDKNKAEEVYNIIVKKDRNIKEKRVYEIFSKN